VREAENKSSNNIRGVGPAD